MKKILQYFSYAGLGLTVVPSLAAWGGAITLDTNRVLMLVGAALWFGLAPLWMRRR